MKKFILVFVMLGVALTQLLAKIGDTEQQVLMQNLGTQVDRDTIDERAKVIVFTTDITGAHTGFTQYAVGILDGKVESEVFTTSWDGKPQKELVFGTLHTLAEVWYPVSCGEDCVATMSADGMFFAKIGPSKELKKQNVFWVFSDAWRQFAISKKGKGAKGVTL